MSRQRQYVQRTFRAVVGVVAAVCVLGFASLAFLHNAARPSMAASALPGPVGDPPVAGNAATSATSGIPSAESVFRGAPYLAPEETIEQF
jgi:hypothetical protein